MVIKTSEYIGEEVFAKKSVNICFIFYTQMSGIIWFYISELKA